MFAHSATAGKPCCIGESTFSLSLGCERRREVWQPCSSDGETTQALATVRITCRAQAGLSKADEVNFVIPRIRHSRTRLPARGGTKDGPEPLGQGLAQGRQRRPAQPHARAARALAGSNRAAVSGARIGGSQCGNSRISSPQRRCRLSGKDGAGRSVCSALRVFWREFVLEIEKVATSFEPRTSSPGTRQSVARHGNASCDL